MDKLQIAGIATEFDIELRTNMTEADYAEAVRLNREDSTYASGSCCATHNFTDANEVMAAAFSRMMGRDADVDDDQDTALWNAAWDMWRMWAR